jgi:hypothetical protein
MIINKIKKYTKNNNVNGITAQQYNFASITHYNVLIYAIRNHGNIQIQDTVNTNQNWRMDYNWDVGGLSLQNSNTPVPIDSKELMGVG